MILAFALAITAGILNGSYAFPLRYIKHTRDNQIWSLFSILTFLISPWLVLFFLDRHGLKVLYHLPLSIVIFLLIGGLFFGIGMVLFTLSLKYIGMGVSFILNISINTVTVSLAPLIFLDPNKLHSKIGMLEIIAMIIFIIGVILSAKSVIERKQKVKIVNDTRRVMMGIVFGITSGLFTAAQGVSYSCTLPVITHIILAAGNSAIFAANLGWVYIFNAAFLPYFLYFTYKQPRRDIPTKFCANNYFFLILMAVCYYSSLILFSYATVMVGNLGAIICWPLFMISIILTSNFWGLVSGEWKNAETDSITYAVLSIAALITAMLVLAMNAYQNG
jgi:L-rhamnose-H+ transport protein